MRPGLTCLWQIQGRNDLDFDRWMELDLEYIDNWSPLLDIKILGQDHSGRSDRPRRLLDSSRVLKLLAVHASELDCEAGQKVELREVGARDAETALARWKAAEDGTAGAEEAQECPTFDSHTQALGEEVLQATRDPHREGPFVVDSRSPRVEARAAYCQAEKRSLAGRLDLPETAHVEILHRHIEQISRIGSPLELHRGGLTTIEKLHQAIVTGAETQHQPEVLTRIDVQIPLTGLETTAELVAQEGSYSRLPRPRGEFALASASQSNPGEDFQSCVASTYYIYSFAIVSLV